MNAKSNPVEYEEFLRENRLHVNRHLNWILWVCMLTGPAIAFGIWAGGFPEVHYVTCVAIFVFTLVLTVVHTLLKKWKPYSVLVSLFALLGLDALIAFMACAKVGIHLTWFFVPLLGIMLCEYRMVPRSVYHSGNEQGGDPEDRDLYHPEY